MKNNAKTWDAIRRGAAALALTMTAAAQTPPPALPKVPQPRTIAIAYAADGRGRIMAAAEDGTVRQYLEVWENASKLPNVVTYVLIGDGGKALSATWGRGPINRAAFNCSTDQTPEFGEKSLWVATASGGVLTFKEIEDGGVKGLLEDLARARRDWGREVAAFNQRHRANTTEQNILIFMKEKNRKKWLEQGWLQPASGCVRHF